jgi:hypothetical protein
MVTQQCKKSQTIAEQGCNPTHNFEPRPFLNGQSYGIKNYNSKVPFNGITYLPNFMKIYQLVQKLMGGQTHAQKG